MKTFQILFIVVLVAIVAAYAGKNWPTKDVKTPVVSTPVQSEASATTQTGMSKQYLDTTNGYGFSYPEYMEMASSSNADFGLSMKTLPGLGPIVEINVSKTKEKDISGTATKFGTADAIRSDWSMAGANFVRFEIQLANGSYVYVQTTKEFVDQKYNESFPADQLAELVKAGKGFEQIKNTFNK